MLLLDNNILKISQFIEDIGCNGEELEQYCFLDKGTLTKQEHSNIIFLKDKLEKVK